MMRGTFANVRLRNELAPGDGRWLYDVLRFSSPRRREAERCHHHLRRRHEAYRDESTPLVVLAGKEYGTGSIPRLGRQGHVQLLGVRRP